MRCNAGHHEQQRNKDVEHSTARQDDREEQALKDDEMEAELAAGLQEDPLAAYDVDVSAEGTAIKQYLELIHEKPQT